jgi:Flp pilus assembly protein TadB
LRLLFNLVVLPSHGVSVWAQRHGSQARARPGRGITQGLVLGIFVVIRGRQRYRKAFVVGGQQASENERAAAVAALRSGQLPVEPRQREAAVSFARYELGRATNPWPVGVSYALLALVLVLLPVTISPWCWLLAGLCIAAIPVVIVSFLRRRQRARRLLMTPILETEQGSIDG